MIFLLPSVNLPFKSFIKITLFTKDLCCATLAVNVLDNTLNQVQMQICTNCSSFLELVHKIYEYGVI